MTALQVVLSEEIHLQFRGECLHVLVVPRLVVRRNCSQNIVCDCVLPIQKLAKVSQYRPESRVLPSARENAQERRGALGIPARV
jgi:hypothetical protein